MLQKQLSNLSRRFASIRIPIRVDSRGILKLTKHTLISYLIICIVFSGTGLIYLFNPFGTKSAEAAWFNDNWGYRKEVPITANTGVDTNTYISFSLDTATLITAGQLQSSCQDIRVTDVSGNILAYHIGRTNACNNAATTIDALVPTLGAGASTFYVYYGNPSVSSKDAGAFSQSEAASYTVGTLGTAATAPSPVAYWKFDDAQGTNAQDSTTNNLDGTMTNFAATPTANSSWQTEDNCISGECLAFDKANDVITAGTPSKLNDIGSVTLSAWVYPISMGEGSAGVIFGKNVGTTPSAGWLLQFAGTNALKLSIDGSTDLVRQTSDSVVTLNQWNHVTVTWDGVITTAASVKIYINGKEVNYATTTDGAARVSDATSTFRIGNDSLGANTFDGKIDEPKVYNQVLTAAQVAANYNARSNPEGVAAALGANTQNLPGALSDGLVGYWKMDEASWTNNCSTTSVTDSSGNSQNLTSCPNSTGPTGGAPGKFGNAGLFDGSDDYLNKSSFNIDSAPAFTAGAWVNFTNVTEKYIMSVNNSFDLRITTNNITFSVKTVSGGFTVYRPTVTIAASQWHHIVGVYDGSNMIVYLDGARVNSQAKTGVIDTAAAPGLTIGSGTISSGFMSGNIDEARVYKRALSASEVSQLYNWAPGPVGYWKMDEKAVDAGSVYDTSGNANTGTLTAGTGGATIGKYGSAYNFDNANTKIDVGTGATLTNLKSGAGLSAEAWIYPKSTGEGGAAGGVIMQKATGATGGAAGTPKGWYFYLTTTNALKFTHDGSTILVCTTATSAVTSNVWNHVAVTWDGSVTATNVNIYANGVKQTCSTATNGVSLNSDSAINMMIGNDSSQADTFDGYIDEAKVYNYSRTSGQVIEDLNAGHPAPGSPVGTPVGFWKFNEGADNTCSGGTNDVCNSGSIGNAIDGTLTATSRTTAGKFGQAFDGADNRRATVADSANLDFVAADDFSISFWFKSDSATNPSANQYLVEKGGSIATDAIGYAVYTSAASDGLICFGIDDDATTFPEDETCSSSDIYDATWHHIVAKKTGTSRLDLYVDGKPNGTADTAISATGTLDNAATFYIGDDNGTDGTDEFLGDMDDVKVFRSALTQSQAMLDMNQGSSEALGALSDKTGTGYESKTNANQEYCIPGDTSTCLAPQGRWDFEEGTGTSARDTSGNGNTGTLSGSTGTPTYATGKVGKSLSFTRSGNHIVTAAASTTLNNLVAQGNGGMTISAWINPNLTVIQNHSIFNKWNTTTGPLWRITNTGSEAKLHFEHNFSGGAGTDLVAESANGAITSGVWQFVTLTWTGSGTATTVHMYVNGREVSYGTQTNGTTTRDSDAADNFVIGSETTNTENFEGRIDQFRAYNYVRTPAQVAWDYNRGAPVAYWKMDECQGTTINDSSGNSLAGTLSIGASGEDTVGTCTTASTAWGSGVTGKRNYSIDLDGADDWITLSNSAINDIPQLTLSTWFFADTQGEGSLGRFFDKTASATTAGWQLNYVNTGELQFQVFYSGTDLQRISTDAAIETGRWNHVAVTWDGSTTGANVHIYVNGRDTSATPQDATLTRSSDAANTLYVGNRSDGARNFDGKLDDVRIYNYPLTFTQVKTLYNEGTARYGPVTGAP